MPGAHDLTDTWHGRYCYPRIHAPVSFVADLRQAGAFLSGTIEEPGQSLGTDVVRTARFSGNLAGNRVTFLKVYDVPVGAGHAVRYAGVVRDEGLEISGTWTIPGNWSGTFLMIRSRGLPLAMSRKQTEKV